MKRMKRVTGILLSCAMMLSLTANAFAAQDNAVATTKVLLEGNTSWTYWDKNVDPAGNEQDSNYDRTVWTKENFDAKDWKTATGTFGSKKEVSIMEPDVQQIHFSMDVTEAIIHQLTSLEQNLM